MVFANLNDLLLPLRASLHPLQGQGLVSRKGSQRLSVRHVSYCVRDDHGLADIALIRRQVDRGVEEVERGPADSRRRSTRASGQTRYADDGRCVDSRISSDFDVALGATI